MLAGLARSMRLCGDLEGPGRAATERGGNDLNGFKYFCTENGSRPESGLDWLTCSEFAQHAGEALAEHAPLRGLRRSSSTRARERGRRERDDRLRALRNVLRWDFRPAMHSQFVTLSVPPPRCPYGTAYGRGCGLSTCGLFKKSVCGRGPSRPPQEIPLWSDVWLPSSLSVFDYYPA